MRMQVALLALFFSAYCYAEPSDEQILQHLYGSSASTGFRDLRERASKSDSNVWYTDTCFARVDGCWVSWAGKRATFVISINSQPFKTFDAAHASFQRWVDFVHAACPELTPISPRPGDADTEKTFFDQKQTDADGNNDAPLINVKIEQNEETKFYDVFVVLESIKSNRAREDALSLERTMAGWVRDDISEYLNAARTRFSTMKSGTMQVRQDGVHWWPATWKPFLADSCEIQESGGMNSVLCVLGKSRFRGEIITQAKELMAAVENALPSDWSKRAKPFPDALASVGFVSSHGESGQIWINKSNDDNYVLYYRLVAAPVR